MISTATHTTQSQALTIIDDENMDKEYKKLTIDDTSQLKESEKESWEEKRGRNQEMEEDCDVEFIAKNIGHEWSEIAIHLGFSKTQKDHLEEKYKNLYERIHCMISTWLRAVKDKGIAYPRRLLAHCVSKENCHLANQIHSKFEVAIVPEDLDSTVQKIIIGQEQQQEISQQYRGDERGKRQKRKISNIERQTLKKIEDHISSKSFVKVKSTLAGKLKLEENWVLIYAGLPGDGKTENAIDIMGTFLEKNPDTCLKILTDISEWSDVDPDIDSVILLDDIFDSTDTSKNYIKQMKNKWDIIYSCVKKGNVKVIFTVQKNILIKSQTELEKYPIFKKEYVIDLTTNEYKLSDGEKYKILSAHFNAKDIKIVQKMNDENYDRADQLDKETPIKISKETMSCIVKTDPVIGFPFSCFLFSCHKKYIQQGQNFFTKPTQDLKDKISSLNNMQSKPLARLEYCIMSYMVLNEGKINLQNLDQDLMEQILRSGDITWSDRTERDLKQASIEINNKYIIGEYPDFEFKHCTIFDCTALCVSEDKASLFLKRCSKRFISEFIRSQKYKQAEGEVVVRLKKSDYKFLVQRILDSCQNRTLHQKYHWWVGLPIMNDVEFVNSFTALIKSNTEYKEIINRNDFFSFVCFIGNTTLLDRIYYELCIQIPNVKECLTLALAHGNRDTVIWFLDSDVGVDTFLEMFENEPNHKTAEFINHKNIRWSHMNLIKVEKILISICTYGKGEDIDKVLTCRADIIIKENINKWFSCACVSGNAGVINYLLNTKPEHINQKVIHLAENEENLTNFHIVAFFGRFQILQKLVDLGLAFTDRTKSNLSVLQCAIIGFMCHGEYPSRVKDIIMRYSCLLKEHCLQLGDGYKLKLGKLHDYANIIKYLINQNCPLEDLDLKLNEKGFTLAHFSVMYNNRFMIKLLKEKRPTLLSVQNEFQHKPIHLAVLMGRYEIFKLLYSKDDEISNGLIVQGQKHAGKILYFSLKENYNKRDFDGFLPTLHSTIKFGDHDDYTKILDCLTRGIDA